MQFRPLVPPDRLIEEVNRIFHSFDAERYDSDHKEMRLLWPGLWDLMLAQLPHRRKWRVLDFGCGTGFEAAHLMSRPIADSIEMIFAFDPSAEMLALARKRLDSARLVLSTSLAPAGDYAPFDLLITNSVLHHLPEPQATMRKLLPLLSHDAVWLSGNEPSAGFYRNQECLQLFREYAAFQQRSKWLTASRYLAKFKSMMGRDSLSKTAAQAHVTGLFAIRPHPDVIAKLVDYHVPLDIGNTGLDLETLGAALPEWRLIWSTSYSFLGAYSELSASGDWLLRARELQQRFPAEGANFCAIWERAPRPAQAPFSTQQ